MGREEEGELTCSRDTPVALNALCKPWTSRSTAWYVSGVRRSVTWAWEAIVQSSCEMGKVRSQRDLLTWGTTKATIVRAFEGRMKCFLLPFLSCWKNAVACGGRGEETYSERDRQGMRDGVSEGRRAGYSTLSTLISSSILRGIPSPVPLHFPLIKFWIAVSREEGSISWQTLLWRGMRSRSEECEQAALLRRACSITPWGALRVHANDGAGVS